MKNAEWEAMDKNNHGFTLLETIFSLCIISLIAFLFPLIISFFKQPVNNELHDKEVELFFMQIGMEIHSAKRLQLDDNMLIIDLNNGDRASYAQYNSLIRRQVKGMGHEVLLQNIESVSFSLHDNIITIQINGYNGKQFERKLAPIGKNL